MVQIFAYIDSKKEYNCIANLSENGHKDTVTDAEWAPQFGRSFHMIATCSKDCQLIIWRLDLIYEINNEHFDKIELKAKKLFSHNHDCEVN